MQQTLKIGYRDHIDNYSVELQDCIVALDVTTHRDYLIFGSADIIDEFCRHNFVEYEGERYMYRRAEVVPTGMYTHVVRYTCVKT